MYIGDALQMLGSFQVFLVTTTMYLSATCISTCRDIARHIVVSKFLILHLLFQISFKMLSDRFLDVIYSYAYMLI